MYRCTDDSAEKHHAGLRGHCPRSLLIAVITSSSLTFLPSRRHSNSDECSV